jgi:hypothetical protein
MFVGGSRKKERAAAEERGGLAGGDICAEGSLLPGHITNIYSFYFISEHSAAKCDMTG